MSKKTILKLSVMVLSLGLVTGCASTDRVKQLEADIARVEQTSQAALDAANEAKSAAGAADSRATAAMDAATAAQNAADDCSERCNRMMQKAMAK